MNKDRRAIAGVLAGVCKAYLPNRTMPPKVMLVIRDEIKAIAATEALSIKKMESYKDSPSTAANYAKGVEAHEDLTQALEYLEDGELADAHELLLSVASGAAEPVTATPKRRR